jgi:hypothetical protein
MKARTSAPVLLHRLGCLALAITGLVVLAAPGPRRVGRAPFTTFNTVCAKCHEAECSGRLSFQGGVDSTREHVRRYAGSASDAEVTEFFELLRHMKEQCSYYPAVEGAVPGGAWDAAALASFFEPSERSYFLPLGTFRTAECRVRLHFDRDTAASAQVMASPLETALEVALPTAERDAMLSWPCRADESYYLRLRAAGEARLVRLEPVR